MRRCYVTFVDFVSVAFTSPDAAAVEAKAAITDFYASDTDLWQCESNPRLSGVWSFGLSPPSLGKGQCFRAETQSLEGIMISDFGKLLHLSRIESQFET